jgi:cell division septation protein DedD
LPAVPKPAQPTVPELPGPPLPAKSSDAGAARRVEPAQMPQAAAVPAPAKAAARKASRRPEAAARNDASIHGYVVYVGAFENTAKAASLVEELKLRKLAAQTSVVAKPGRKPLLTVWVGPFDGRSDAVAILPTIREVGVDDAMIRAIP